MGMSSSQARLLSLTGRMHDIEYKAQHLQAQKLQMANESTAVYKEYENALNMTKLQKSIINSDGTAKYIDLSLNTLAPSMYVKNIENNKTYISEASATKYSLDGTGVVGSEVEFMNNAGFVVSVNSFEPISNTGSSDIYTPVTNNVAASSSREVPIINPDWGFQEASTQNITGGISVKDVASFDTTKTYTLSTKEDLIALQTLTNSGISTQGVNFVMTNNIDMTGVTGWSGIGTNTNRFKGNFNGNGFAIENLTANQGLFCIVEGNQTSTTNSSTGVNTTSTYGKIENVKMLNVNIDGRISMVGGIVAKGFKADIKNCYVSGKIINAYHAGGLMGENEGSAISQSTTNVDVTSRSTCVGGFIGHDTNGILSHCISQGDVNDPTNKGYIAGLIGHETPQGGANGNTFIYQSATTGTVTSGASNKGSFIGQIDGSCAATVIGSQYKQQAGVNDVGSGANKLTSEGNGTSLSATGTITVTTNNITIPSKISVKSNIGRMIEKSSKSVSPDFQSKLDAWLNQFYQIDTRFTGNILTNNSLKLASLNDFVAGYLTNSNGVSETFVNNLISDIDNNTLTSTSAQQDKYKNTLQYEYTGYAATSATLAGKQTTINTANSKNIGNNIYTALRKAGHTDFSDANDVETVQTWLAAKFPTTSEPNKVALANINEYVVNYLNGTTTDSTEINKLYNAIKNNGTYTMSSSAMTYNNPSTSHKSNMAAYNEQANDISWDLNNSDIVEALDFYETIKNGYIVVSDEKASSNKWITNIINSGTGLMCIYNNISNTSEETNIATNTNLQEIQDKTALLKAEAKYEADMRKIDSKDKKFDTDIAALEAERNAIKTEMDTLKTVTKDNVDRTFKLFS